MSTEPLSDIVAALARETGVPGAAVGILADGQVSFACHGVTSAAHPQAVNPHTLFVMGSVTKTFTATALMRLEAQGALDLQAPVRRYIPELRLADSSATDSVTVWHLLTHTSGLDWRVEGDTGEGDDALAREVANLAGAKLVAPPGERVSYSQAGYDLAGRVIEKVTGQTFEAAIATLLTCPLGLDDSLFFRDEVMLRRFAVGHTLAPGGAPTVVRPWRHWRSDNPGAGLASSVADQLRWASFHLGDGRGPNGDRLLPEPSLRCMHTPWMPLQDSSLGDAVGLGWFLDRVDGLATVGHDGSANGQFASLLLAPEPNFAVVTLSNAGPDAGLAFNRMARIQVLEHYLGVRATDPEPLPFDRCRSNEVLGTYQNDFMTLIVQSDDQQLSIACLIRPELRATSASVMPDDVPAAPLGFLSVGDDSFVVMGGGLKGQRGAFRRDPSGAVCSLNLAGRTFDRCSRSHGPKPLWASPACDPRSVSQD
jgi:CubicO group peptidase (beta-lactamase class C family)